MISSLIDEYYSSLPAYLPKWLQPIASIPDAEKFTQIVLSNLSESAVKMLVAHYGGNENETENAERHKQEFLTSIDGFVHELCRESMGVLGGITTKVLLRSNAIRKAKLAVSSIWDNIAVYNNKQYASINKPVNDLHCLLTLQDNKLNIDNENFYANSNDENEIKVKLSSNNSDNEEEQQVFPKNKFAILSKEVSVVAE